MSHPTFWPKNPSFYPIGNTPPVCLTDHLPPEQDALILLLGCGDPRNILYTVAVDHNPPNRAMDITCCDWEPAIIARNTLLFAFIKDSVEPNRVLQYWSIFYDLFLDKQTASLLDEQCKKLIGHAIDTTTWEASPYGKFLKFSTEDSLSKARQHWNSYRETFSLPVAKQKELKQMFSSAMKAKSTATFGTTAIPSAIPLCFEFPTETCKTHTQYWESGITNPSVGPNIPTQINPTFLFSMAGRPFNLHHETDLCSSFHLALALSKISFDGGSASTPAKTEHEMWEACRVQFSRWSVAFRKRILGRNETSNIIIRLAVGDAFAFCDGLRLCQTGDFTPTIYSSAWGAAKFSFHDRSMPTLFNVVDTSNLSDHLGLLNVLIAVTPLLQKKPYTILHTNSLLSYEDHPRQRSAIEERALVDFPTLALFLSITPLCYSSGLTFRNGCETAMYLAIMVESGRFYERISWRFSDFVDADWNGSAAQRNHEVHFRPADLADKLFSVYLKMFDDESLPSLFRQLDAGNINIEYAHYHKQSFVRFLSVIRACSCIKTDWTATIESLINRVMASGDLVVIGSDNYQHFFAELHMWGLYSRLMFHPGYVPAHFGAKPVPFATWDTIPPVVCIILKVPRAALKPLEEIPVNETRHPNLVCETHHHSFHVHSSIRPIFGDIVYSEGRMVIVEDPQGLSGDSPLIVSFFVASWILADRPNDLQVSLRMQCIPADLGFFVSQLGIDLRLYSSKLLNRTNVFILPERPDNQGELLRSATMNSPPRFQGIPNVTVASLDKETILSKRLDIVEPDVKQALANKASVSITQITPSSMEVRSGDHIHYSLRYPIPVDGARAKFRVARKSCYVEVDVPLRNSPLGQVTLQPFPMHFNTEVTPTHPVCWNAPYVNLSRLPSLTPSGDLEWIQTHLGICLTRNERALQYSTPVKRWGPSMSFKKTLANIFLSYIATKNKIYALHDPSFQNAHAIIFLSSLRLDLSSAAVIGDAAVVFPDITTAPLLLRCLGGSSTMMATVYGQEIRMWNHALPVFAERCRQWQHLPTCEYIQRQQVPLSAEYEKNPLCSCGKGKNLGPFLENSQWKPLAPHAIRIALTPIFPVTYLEDVTEQVTRGVLREAMNWLPTGIFPPRTASFIQENANGCERCDGPGKPKLLNCGGCQSVKYCSKDCQMADWKRHKRTCKLLGKRST